MKKSIKIMQKSKNLIEKRLKTIKITKRLQK